MTVLNTSSVSVNLADVTTVRIKNSLWAYVPKTVSVIILLFALFMIANLGGAILGGFPANASIWERIGGTLFFLFFIGVALAVGFAAIKILTSDDVDEGDLTMLRWVIGIAAVLGLSGAAFSFNSVETIQQTGGSFGNDAVRLEYIQSLQTNATIQVLTVFVLVLSILSLGLVGRKDVYLTRASGTEKVGNLSREDAIMIKNAARNAG